MILLRLFENVESGLYTLWLYLFFIDNVLVLPFVNCKLITDVPYSSCLCGVKKFSLLIWFTFFLTAKNT